MLVTEMLEMYDTSVADINKDRFTEYFTKEFGRTFEQAGLTYEQALQAKRVVRNGRLTLAGMMFFGKEPQAVKPAFGIKAVAFIAMI